MTYMLIDGKVGMTNLDEEFANKLTDFKVDYCVCCQMSLVTRKPVFGVSDQVRHKLDAQLQ